MKPITGPELCRKLERPGWTLKRVRGGHHIYAKTGEKKILSVPSMEATAGPHPRELAQRTTT